MSNRHNKGLIQIDRKGNVLIVSNRHNNESKVTGRHNNGSKATDRHSNREAATMYSTGSKMAEGNANQAGAARPAGRTWVATTAPGAVQVVMAAEAAAASGKQNPDREFIHTERKR